MVFGPSEMVTGWGRLVIDSEGEWLDLAHSVTLPWTGRPRPRSRYSVRLVGADASAVPTDFGPGNVIPDHLTITGAWRDGVIAVSSQSPYGPPTPSVPRWTNPPCAPPASGWPSGPKDENIDADLRNLVSSGVAVAVGICRPSPYQAVLVVAANDVEAVESVLRPQLNGRLCVVASRWSRPYLDKIRAHLVARRQDWTIDMVSETIDERAQASITAWSMWVTSDMADWAEAIEAEVLTLEPSLVPVAFRTTT